MKNLSARDYSTHHVKRLIAHPRGNLARVLFVFLIGIGIGIVP